MPASTRARGRLCRAPPPFYPGTGTGRLRKAAGGYPGLRRETDQTTTGRLNRNPLQFSRRPHIPGRVERNPGQATGRGTRIALPGRQSGRPPGSQRALGNLEPTHGLFPSQHARLFNDG